MEWDEETRETIIEKHRDINVENNWWEFVYESWEEKLLSMGFDITDTELVDERKYDKETGRFKSTGNKVSRKIHNIQFSGFWSQGDGASFTGTVDFIVWLEYKNDPKYARILKLMKSGVIYNVANIKRDRWHNYVHENTTSLYTEWYFDKPNIQSLLEEIETQCFEHHRELNEELYRDLENEYENLTSDEQVIDTLEINEYEFDNEGNIM
jgi:hypothetical protein